MKKIMITKQTEVYKHDCTVCSWYVLLCYTDNLTDEQKQWFIDYYKKLCHVGLEKNKASSRVTMAVSDKERTKVSH